MEWKLDDSRPIWPQLKQQLIVAIVAGKFAMGGAFPTVRELAEDAGVNRNTMQRALSELENDGFVTTNRTAGRTVTEDGVILSEICMRLANEKISQYLKSMALLGFPKKEAIELLLKWEEES